MRIDHIAYRVKDRHQTVKFFQEALNYKIADEFEVNFDDGSSAKCFALEPPEKIQCMPYSHLSFGVWDMHMAPEIFVSDGSPDSIVGKWVEERGGGGVHHLAYRLKDIDETVKEWKKNGVEFLTEGVIDCPDDDLRQIFTKPLEEFGGVIIELIERGDKGFCQNSVKNLMESTKELK